MNLLLTLDENYLLPCKVMLRSFFAANPSEKDVTVYLLHSAIPAEKLRELADFCAGFGAELKPIAVDTALFASAPTSKRYPKEMYYRLLSPLILPDQDVFNMLYGTVEDALWSYDVRNYSKYLIRSGGRYDLNWVMQNTAVLHFCGKNKPWERGL